MFSSTIIYLELFIALFFLPGFFITVIFGIKKFRFLLSFALSYFLLVITLMPFEYYAQPIARWQWCVLLEWVILAVLAVAKTLMNRNSKKVGPDCPAFVASRLTTAEQAQSGPPASLSEALRAGRPNGRSVAGQAVPPYPGKSSPSADGPNLIRGLLNHRLLIPLVLAGVICGYLAYAGPYLEIPSDARSHIERFQWQRLNVIDQECFPPDLSLSNIFLHDITCRYWYFNPWYFIHSWICNISGLPIMDSIHVLTFVNVLTFLLAIYYFGLYLFAGLRISAFKKIMMAALASLFAAATMGNMVFAFIRYYAFAPAILNYVLFIAAMVVIIAWLRSNRLFGHALWIAPVLLIVTSVIHTQEALFIFYMTLALGLLGCFSLCWHKFRHRNFNLGSRAGNGVDSSGGHGLTPAATRNSCRLGRPNSFSTAGRSVYGNRCSAREWKTVILAASLLFVFFAGFIIVRHFKPGAWISSAMIMPSVSIPSEPVNFIFRDLMISPPHNPWLRLAVYQLFIFYQVVGSWGLFVYLLFLLMIRHFVKIHYLTAGMIIIPFLTAFNPLTVDMMVRLGQDPTIYRFHYLIPLPFVGGYLFVHFLGKVREWFHRMCLAPVESISSIWPRLSWINFVGCIMVLAGLIGLMFPINAAGIYAPYSKIYTLRKIPAGNDYRLWSDFGKFIDKYENKVILMDYLTRFMMYCSLKNNNCVCSEWLNSRNPEKDQPVPYTWKSLRGRGMIVINRRNGAPSITGRIAKHWPEDVLSKVSRNYSIEAQHYLESHPEKFRKVWSQNRIAVYAVY